MAGDDSIRSRASKWYVYLIEAAGSSLQPHKFFLSFFFHLKAWQHLPAALQNDAFDPFAAAHGGRGLWDYYERNDDRRRQFARAMTAADSATWYGVLHDFHWGGYKRVVDIGGSLGSMLHRVLSSSHASGGHHHQQQGVLFDRPSVIAQARLAWDLRAGASEVERNITGRVEFVGGDFFDHASLPQARDGDVYVM